MKKWDVIVIGSGISSLTAAAILAKKGRSVLVLEKHTKPGGYLHCFKRFGRRFETGAHYFGALDPGQAFHTLLSYVGVYDPELFLPLADEGFDELYFPTFRARFSKGYERTLEALQQQFPHERAGLEAYFRQLAHASALFPTYAYRDEYDERELHGVLHTSLKTVVERLIRDPRVQCVLYSYCSLHGVAPADIAFGFHAMVTDSLLTGVYGLRHGGDAIAQKYVKVIESFGGTVQARNGVNELRVVNGEVDEVITERGEALRAEWVISGMHPKGTLRLVKDAETHLRPAFLDRVRKLPESVGLLGVYAICREAQQFEVDRNYYFFDSEDPSQLMTERPIGNEPSAVFAARAERTTSDPAALVFHAPGPMAWFEPWRETRFNKRPDDYERFKEARAEEIVRFVERFPGFGGGLRARLEKFDVSTPVTNLHFNGSEDGSAYGIYHSMDQTGERALGPRTRIKNLILTGQSSLFPGLLGAANSGLRSAGSIVGIKELLRELRDLRFAAGSPATGFQHAGQFNPLSESRGHAP